MEKKDIDEIRTDIKYKRDCLHLAHEDLKRQSDFWNKIIIFVSLGSSVFETTKMKMEWGNPVLELFPILLSSLVAGISSLIKFKRYNEQQEVLIQSVTILTNTLNTARNQDDVTPELTNAYHHSLELLEISLYPDVRKRFLKASQKNLLSIMKSENAYFNVIEKQNRGELITSCPSDSSSENVIIHKASDI